MHSGNQPNHLGFAGLGAMAFAIVSSLIKKNFLVSVFDVSVNAIENLSRAGSRSCVSASEAAKNQHKFFILVATEVQADAVIFGAHGLIHALPKKAIICLFSTVSPVYVTSLPERLLAAGRQDLRLLDCPVSGGFVGAADGTLSIMMSGDPQSIQAVQPELLAISAPARLFPTGDLGSASTLRMIGQHLAGVHVAAAAEVLAFAKSLGLSTKQAHELLMSSEGASWIMGDRGKTMLSGDWVSKSTVDIFIHELGIAIEAADDFQLSCPIVSTAAEIFMERSSTGYGQDDDASIVCIYEEIMGKAVAENITPKEATHAKVDIKSEPLVLVTGNNEFRRQFSASSQAQTLPSNDWDSLLQSFSQLAPGTLVGVDEARLLSVSPFNAHLVFFDYIVLSQVDKSPHILFTNSHRAIKTSLKTALGPSSTVTPVMGGSALDMARVIDLAALIHMAASAENFALANSAGAVPKLVYDLVSGGEGSSTQFSHMYPKMLSKDYTLESGLRSLEEAEKAMRKMKVAMKDVKFPGRLCNASHQMFKSALRKPAASGRSAAALVSAWI